MPLVALLLMPSIAAAAANEDVKDGATDGALRTGAFQIRAGATYRRLWDIPIVAGEVGGAIGHWGERGGDYFTLDAMLAGRTENGLAVWGIAAGYRTDWRVGRARFGGNVALQVVTIERATGGGSMSSAGVAFGAFAGFDVVQTSSGVLAVDLALNADPMFGQERVFVWGPTLAASFRF